MSLKSEGSSGRAELDERESPDESKETYQAKRLGGLISCVLGLLLGLGGIVGPFLALTEDVSPGVLAMVLGVLG